MSRQEYYVQSYCAWLREPPTRTLPLLDQIRNLVPSSLAPITRLFDAHTSPCRVMVTGLPGSGKMTLLEKHMAQTWRQSLVNRDVPENILPPGHPPYTNEVWFGPFLHRPTPTHDGGAVGHEKPEQHCIFTYDMFGSDRFGAVERRMCADSDAVVWMMNAWESNTPDESLEEVSEIVLAPQGLHPDKPVLILLNWREAKQEEMGTKVGLSSFCGHRRSEIELLATANANQSLFIRAYASCEFETGICQVDGVANLGKHEPTHSLTAEVGHSVLASTNCEFHLACCRSKQIPRRWSAGSLSVVKRCVAKQAGQGDARN
jgi:hypothetical protein